MGVHSGVQVNLTIKPAPANHGIKFVRTDLPDTPAISAIFNRVVDTSLATVIGDGGAIVSTIEHLMASFAGLSIDNAVVEIDGYEMPIMDGSASVFTDALFEAGVKELDTPRFFFIVTRPFELIDNEKSVRITPCPSFRLTCSIEFDHPLIGQQSYTLDFNEELFVREISRARTFGFYREIEHLKRYGLARGATLDTGIAIDNDSIMNKEGLRYPDEFVRHKLLDCLGDFSLLGMPVIGHITTNRSGHAFNHSFLETFFSKKECWETRPLEKSKGVHEFAVNQ